MPQATYDKSAPKRALNVSINADLAAKAKALGINFSETLESRLDELVREQERVAWLEQNKPAIDAYNKRVSDERILSDFDRQF